MCRRRLMMVVSKGKQKGGDFIDCCTVKVGFGIRVHCLVRFSAVCIISLVAAGLCWSFDVAQHARSYIRFRQRGMEMYMRMYIYIYGSVRVFVSICAGAYAQAVCLRRQTVLSQFLEKHADDTEFIRNSKKEKLGKKMKRRTGKFDGKAGRYGRSQPYEGGKHNGIFMQVQYQTPGGYHG